MRRHRISSAAAMSLVLCLCGCFARDENIVVHPDGSASVTYEVEGDGDDILSGDALPALPGWRFTDATSADARGKGELSYQWEAELSDLNDYPASLASPEDPDADLHLRMETRLEREEEPGRTIYRFTRRYIGRRAGKFRELQESAVPADLMERAESEGGEPLTSEEQERLFLGLAEYEAGAIFLRLRDALGMAALEGILALDDHTRIMERLQEYLEERMTGEYLRQFFTFNEHRQELEQERLAAEIRDHFAAMLPAAARERVLLLLHREEKRFEVTDDLNNETFWLTVTLPGTVVSCSGLMAAENEASWEFSGEDLVDGDLVFTAVSVLEHEP